MDGSLKTVVIDPGSSCVKVGFSSDNTPVSIFNNVTGKSKHPLISSGMGGKDVYVGDEVLSQQRILDIKRPVQRGVIVDEELLVQTFVHSYEKSLKVDPISHPLLLALPSLIGKTVKEDLTQLLFEELSVPSLSMCLGPALSVFATGRTSGVVVDIGGGCTEIIPMVDGVPLSQSYCKVQMGGMDLTERLARDIIASTERLDFPSLSSSPSLFDIYSKMKEDSCYVSMNFEAELRATAHSKDHSAIHRSHVFKLPDGKEITMDKERFLCSEGLFHPSILGKESAGIPELVAGVVSEVGVDVRSRMWSSVILSGGTTLLPRFNERMDTELSELSNGKKVSIVANENRLILNWMGGSLVASLPTFRDLFVSKEEYEEIGPSICLKKGFF
ncbi:Actin [Aduncisulcus paluster]|uniref:Actin n=1 Tax=Aduncisulcus paluster TaxID=2918883 RepID=A0ABQ5KU48_9EUKA|nr:Actin [Aduncisulcus paluster]